MLHDPDNTIQLQPAASTWLDLKESHPVSGVVYTGDKLGNICSTDCFETLLCARSFPALYPTKSRCFSSPDLLLSTATAQWHCYQATHFFVLQQESVLRQKAKAYMGINFIVFPFSWRLQFCVCCSMSQNSCVMYFSPFVVFSRWQVCNCYSIMTEVMPLIKHLQSVLFFNILIWF